MRRFSAIVRATAQEICSEPLALLLTLSAAALAFLAPRLNYHQFGDPTRMAMESGFSAQLVIGFAFTVFCTVRVFRREIESGTLQMALAHSVSRGAFFLAKSLGAFLAYLVFAVTIFSLTVTVTRGAAIGTEIARAQNDIPALFGPTVVLATAVLLVPLALAAALNYFFRCRFTRTATVTMLLVAALAQFFYFDAALWRRLVPLALLLAFPAAIVTAASAAFAVRWRDHTASALALLLSAAMLPFFGNYYLPGAIAKGHSLATGYLALAAGATLPLVSAFLGLGVMLFESRELGGD